MAVSPVYSMTAYGFGELTQASTTYSCEIRTLNSRFLEVSVRLPRPLLALETDLINHVKAALRRGKVDVFVEMALPATSRELPQLDREVLAHYLSVAEQISIAGGVGKPSVAELMRLDGVLTTADVRARPRGEGAAEAHREPVFAALDKALRATEAARRKEGEALARALVVLADQLEDGRLQVAEKRAVLLPGLHKAYLKRIDTLLTTLQKSGPTALATLPEERLIAEAAVLVDKADIEEELTRLAQHVVEFRRVLREEEAAGRKLDFLCQEMHREVNTMGNKLVQTEVSQHTLEMKQTVERIRQQVQNIE